MKAKTNSKQDYQNLFELSREAKVIEGIASHIGWDTETYMPTGAAAIRSEQRELLAGLAHERRTSRKYREALSKLVELKTGNIVATGLPATQRAALREWHRDYRISTALPTAFVRNFTKLTSDAAVVWRQARSSNDFKNFAPWLQRLVDASRKKADLLGYQEHPYDALLDLYEPHMTTKDLTPLFGTLKNPVQKLLKHIQHAKAIDSRVLQGKFETTQQIDLANQLLKAIGYDLNHGRLDISTHPFSNASHPTDSRITTRIDHNNPSSSILAVLHEAGHGLYEQGLPIEEYGSPLGEAVSLGMHESQSRFWETRIGLSKPFWRFFLPIMQEVFPKQFKKASLLDVYRAVNKVEPSMIRVEADEVTYTLHVILRFEIELALIEGALKIKDIPEVWNAKMTESLGITPRNYAEGCLQDIHWSLGAFGYFPSYSLGNIYAGMLFSAFEKDFPKWQKSVEKGDFAFVRNWLTDNVHRHGRCYSSPDLIKRITGRKISVEPYVKYLESKYHDVYSL